MLQHNATRDDEGNRLTKTKISTGEKEEYTWDHRNRLTKITFKNSGGTVLKTVDQTYDVFNRWIRRSVDNDGPGSGAAVDTFFSHEDDQVALQFNGSTAASLAHRYFWNPAAVDQLLADEAVTSLSSAGTVQYPLGDHLGTLRDLATYDAGTNTTTIANHRRYDSYGNLSSETNAAVDQLFGFTGRALDESTGLQNNLNRWYDSRSGQWPSEDPIGIDAGDTNLRRYVGNRPLEHSDPSGMIWGMGVPTFDDYLYYLTHPWEQDTDIQIAQGVAVGVAATAAAAAGGLAIYGACGGATMTVGFVEGTQGAHIAYGVTQGGVTTAQHYVVGVGVTGYPAGYFLAEGGYWTSIGGIPVFFPEAALASAAGTTCYGAALYALRAGVIGR